MEFECRRLVGKTIVVTGGASGIGEATVYRMLAEGANVVVGDVDQQGAERVAANIEKLGCLDRFGFYPCDVAEEQDIVRLLRYTLDRFERLDCMTNNAATGGAFRPLVDTSVEDWDRTQHVNLRGAFLGTKHAALIMIKQGQGGSIINVSSVAADSGGAAGTAYSASKAGVLALTRSAAVQLGKHFIRCNAVIPGAIVSPLTHRNIDPEGMKAIAAEMQPIPIAGEPDLIAPAFAFLASDDSRFMNGETLVIDGGATAEGQNLYSGKNPFGNAIMDRARRAGVWSFDYGARVQKYQSPAGKSVLEKVAWIQDNAGKQIRKILITGVSRGLGYELCRGFVRLGHTIIGCARTPETVERLKKEFGPQHHFQVVDIATDAQVKSWAEAALASVGIPDLLLNNAAISNDSKQIWRFSEAEVEKVLRVNVLGTVNVIRHFLPAMIRRMSGIIVNFSSGWGRDAAPRVAPYCASKWAIEGLTKAMALEIPSKMAVVSLHPGIIQTDTLRASFGDSAQLYPTPEDWAKVAVPFVLDIRPEDNGRQLSVPGMTMFRGMGKLPKSESGTEPR